MSEPGEPGQPGDRAAPATPGTPGSDAVLPVMVGTALWAVALVVLLVMRDRLRADDADWWIWVAVAGLVLGIAGTAWVRRRRDAYRSSSNGRASS